MKYLINGYQYTAVINKFPAGEQGVVLSSGHQPLHAGIIQIEYDWAEYKDSGVLVVAQLLDALRRRYSMDTFKTSLLLKYVPYSRQDRVCNKGESFSLKVFAAQINSLGFDEVVTWDNHSDVATALIDNCKNLTINELLRKSAVWDKAYHNAAMLVSPDAGAIKKTISFAKSTGNDTIVRADKQRNVRTGEILNCQVLDYHLIFDNNSFIVVDDICDGGGTFIGLGEAIKKINPSAKLELFVTHGFFTKGLDKLLKLYDTIYTTDSVCRIKNDKLVILGD